MGKRYLIVAGNSEFPFDTMEEALSWLLGSGFSRWDVYSDPGKFGSWDEALEAAREIEAQLRSRMEGDFGE